MAKRKSIGRDPLDWIGEQPAPPSGAAPGGGNGSAPAGGWEDGAAGAGEASARLTLAAPAAEFQLERQLLLVDGVLRERRGRPRLNQLLLALVLLLAFAGVGLLLLREARRQWNDRVASLEGTVELLARESGRNQRALEQVLSEKELVLKEKQAAIARLEAIHQAAQEELQFARAESRRLLGENRILLRRVLEGGPAEQHSPADPPSDPPPGQD